MYADGKRIRTSGNQETKGSNRKGHEGTQRRIIAIIAEIGTQTFETQRNGGSGGADNLR